jgi:hypothetical protein
MKGNKGLLDKNRFKGWEEERTNKLKILTLKEAVKMTENLLSSMLIEELRDNFFDDMPLCLKLSLKRQKNEVKKHI